MSLNPAGTMALICTPGWYLDNGNSASAGIADTFTLTAGAWSHKAQLTLASHALNAQFGAAAALGENELCAIRRPGPEGGRRPRRRRRRSVLNSLIEECK